MENHGLEKKLTRLKHPRFEILKNQGLEDTIKKGRLQLQYNWENIFRKYEKMEPSGVEVDLTTFDVYAPDSMPIQEVRKVQRDIMAKGELFGKAEMSAPNNDPEVFSDDDALAKRCARRDKEFGDILKVAHTQKLWARRQPVMRRRKITTVTTKTVQYVSRRGRGDQQHVVRSPEEFDAILAADGIANIFENRNHRKAIRFRAESYRETSGPPSPSRAICPPERRMAIEYRPLSPGYESFRQNRSPSRYSEYSATPSPIRSRQRMNDEQYAHGSRFRYRSPGFYRDVSGPPSARKSRERMTDVYRQLSPSPVYQNRPDVYRPRSPSPVYQNRPSSSGERFRSRCSYRSTSPIYHRDVSASDEDELASDDDSREMHHDVPIRRRISTPIRRRSGSIHQSLENLNRKGLFTHIYPRDMSESDQEELASDDGRRVNHDDVTGSRQPATPIRRRSGSMHQSLENLNRKGIFTEIPPNEVGRDARSASLENELSLVTAPIMASSAKTPSVLNSASSSKRRKTVSPPVPGTRSSERIAQMKRERELAAVEATSATATPKRQMKRKSQASAPAHSAKRAACKDLMSPKEEDEVEDGTEDSGWLVSCRDWVASLDEDRRLVKFAKSPLIQAIISNQSGELTILDAFISHIDNFVNDSSGRENRGGLDYAQHEELMMERKAKRRNKMIGAGYFV